MKSSGRDGRFLSSEFKAGRIARELGWIGVAGAMAGSAYLAFWNVEPVAVALALVVWGGAGWLAARAWMERRNRAALSAAAGAPTRTDEHGVAPEFTYWFRSSVTAAASLFPLPLFALGLVAFAGPRLLDILRQTSEMNETVFVGLAAGACVLIVAVAVALLLPLRRIVFGVSIRNGTLILRMLLGRRRVAIEGLEIEKILSAKGRVEGFRLEAGGKAVCVPSQPAGKAEGEGLAMIEDALRARGCSPSVAGKLIDISPARRWLGVLPSVLVPTFCLILPFGLVAGFAFWISWLVLGTVNVLVYLDILLFGWLGVGVVLLVSPFRAWLAKALLGEWRVAGGKGVAGVEGSLGGDPAVHRDSSPAAPSLAILAADALALPLSSLDAPMRRGRLAFDADADSLVLEIGGRTHRVPRVQAGAVSGEAVSPWSVSFIPNPRFRATPVLLDWRDENGERHALGILSRAGSSFRMDARIERALFDALVRWREAGVAPDFASFRPGRIRLAYCLAVGFVLAGFLLPWIHNHLIMTRIRTGAWGPPSWVSPRYPLVPQGPFLMSVPDGNIALQEYTNPEKGVDMSTVFRLWWGNLATGGRRLVSGTGALLIPSTPGRPTHAFSQHAFLHPLLLIPPRARPDPADFPPQVVDLETGRAVDLPQVPGEYRNRGHALYGGERFFCLREVDARTSPVTVLVPAGSSYLMGMPMGPADPAILPDPLMFGFDPGAVESSKTGSAALVPRQSVVRFPIYEPVWVDLRTRQTHTLPRLEGEFDGQPLDFQGEGIFFPGGRHVLVNWHVFDLDAGTMAHVPLPSGFPSYLHSFAPSVTTVPFESRLRVFSPARGDDDSGVSVHEIDPVAVRCERIDELPAGVSVVSVDANRWLLRRNVDAEIVAPPAPSVTDDTTRETRRAGGRPATPFTERGEPDVELILYDHDSGTSRVLFREPKAVFYKLVEGRDRVLVLNGKAGWTQRDLSPR